MLSNSHLLQIETNQSEVLVSNPLLAFLYLFIAFPIPPVVTSIRDQSSPATRTRSKEQGGRVRRDSRNSEPKTPTTWAKRKLKEEKGRRKGVLNIWRQCSKRTLWRQSSSRNWGKASCWFGQYEGKEGGKDKQGTKAK